MEIIKDMQKGVMPTEVRKTLIIVDREEAIKTACMLAQDKDIILIAGKGHETYQEFADTITPFDDRQVVRELINLKRLRPNPPA